MFHLGVEEVVFVATDNRGNIHTEHHDNELVEGLEKNLAHHRLGNDTVLVGDTVALHIRRRLLSGEGDGGKHVHNEVDPEELHDVERRVASDDNSANDKEHGRQVDGKLVLNESADVVLNVAAEADSGAESFEPVVHDDDITVILGSITTILAHGETNVGFTKGTCVTETFTSDTNDGIGVAECGGENMLKLGSSSVNETNLLLDLLAEPGPGLWVLEVPGYTTAFFSIFYDFHLSLQKLKELMSRHNIFFFVNIFLHAELDSALKHGELMVT